MNLKLKYQIIAALALLIFCSRREQFEIKETILARVGEKTISVNEFIRRAEHTIRPPYCRGDQALDKKIVLNSLIAEKLMAIETGEENELINNPRIQAYLRGRQEQAMRQWQYHKEAQEKVVLDTARVKKTASLIGRKYRIAYFNVPDSAVIHRMSREIIGENRAFDEVYFERMGADSLPQREVEWKPSEHDLILDSLYSGRLTRNQVVGPIKLDDNEYVLIKILGWIDRPGLLESQVQQRQQDVSDRLTQRAARVIYDNYIRELMKGKTIEFTPNTFYKVADLLGPIYVKNDDEKKRLMNQRYWNEDEDIERHRDLQTQLEAFYQEPFFKVDDRVWTVKDFVDELASHPLVFRKKKMKPNEFGQQLQFAIMDMIRDRYLTEEAYRKSYDRVNLIERDLSMWTDNLSGQYYKHGLLKSMLSNGNTEVNQLQLIEDHLNAHVDSLQAKYSDMIEINVTAFDNINLTRTDMSVTMTNVPFPKTVPSFPLVTTDNRLDYGKRMNSN